VVINATSAELGPEALLAAAELEVDGAAVLLVVLLLPPQAAISTTIATATSTPSLARCTLSPFGSGTV
jgi:hypothetical protein